MRANARSSSLYSGTEWWRSFSRIFNTVPLLPGGRSHPFITSPVFLPFPVFVWTALYMYMCIALQRLMQWRGVREHPLSSQHTSSPPQLRSNFVLKKSTSKYWKRWPPGFLTALECTEFVFDHDPTGSLYSAPLDPLANLRGPYF